VTVYNLAVQPGGALHRTRRATANVTWNPITRADVVLEFLTGERLNQDGQRGVSNQIQAGWKVRF
jgi:pimeloyl-CoA synthetase